MGLKTFRKIPARQRFFAACCCCSSPVSLFHEQRQTEMLILIFIDYSTLPPTTQKQLEKKKGSFESFHEFSNNSQHNFNVVDE